MARKLRPSLTAACAALSGELPAGERVVDVVSWNARGALMVSTDSDELEGITIYGYSDEEPSR